MVNEDSIVNKIENSHVSICVSAACAISGTSGTNLAMAVTHPEILQMLRKSDSRLIHRCRFQIRNQISHIDNTFAGIHCPICDKLTPHGISKIFNEINTDKLYFRSMHIRIPVFDLSCRIRD